MIAMQRHSIVETVSSASHRWLVRVLAIVLFGAGSFCHGAEKPNVLMIVVDDMNDWVGCLGGHPQVQTPNIDRLAQRGLLFTNAHVPAPVCNPCRVSVMTGRKPSSTGIYANDVNWHEAVPGITSLPSHFKANGYHVVGGGKVNHHMPGFNRRSDWHDYFDQVFDSHYQDQLARGLQVKNFQWPSGFPLNQIEAVRAFSKPPKNANEFDWGPFDLADHEMGDGKLVEWATQFLAAPPQEPFFLAAGIYRPHLPFYAPRKYFNLYPLDQIIPPEIKEDDCDDLPSSGKAMAADRREDLELVIRAGKYREMLQAYMANISFADALIGQLLDALDASPAAKNTIIVLWSDHGWHLGEKQHLHKFTLWERSTRVPYIIVAPGVTSANVRCRRPVALVDTFPTLNELCSLPMDEGLDGTSLVPLLKDPQLEWDRPALTTHGRGNHALRTERWRYIHYSDGGEELYDHTADPNEWHNLAAKPEFATVKTELARSLPQTDAATLGPKKQKLKK
jgi:arylsulfatase A-like enzyme